MSDLGSPASRILRFRCNFGVGEAIGNAILWFLASILTLGIALLVLAAAIFLYTFSRHSQRLRQHKQASAWQLAK